LPSSLIVLLLVCLCPALAPAQEPGISRRHHPWGCCEAPAWARVRVTTQTFDGNETLTRITETKTTLKEISEDGVTLLVESVVEVGGKKLRSDPQTVKQGWHGEMAGQNVKVTHLGKGEVAIRNRRIPCKIQQVEVTGQASKKTTKIYYSDWFEPFILRRESVTTDLEGDKPLSETTVEVMDVDVPCRLLATIWNTFHVKTVQKNSTGTTTTIAFTSTRVPGGVVRHDSKKVDKSGRLVRHSSLELMNFGMDGYEDQPGPFGPRRPKRPRRPPPLPPLPVPRAPAAAPLSRHDGASPSPRCV
jgi:hypothetical protein